jgi:hypothetical protein
MLETQTGSIAALLPACCPIFAAARLWNRTRTGWRLLSSLVVLSNKMSMNVEQYHDSHQDANTAKNNSPNQFIPNAGSDLCTNCRGRYEFSFPGTKSSPQQSKCDGNQEAQEERVFNSLCKDARRSSHQTK